MNSLGPEKLVCYITYFVISDLFVLSMPFSQDYIYTVHNSITPKLCPHVHNYPFGSPNLSNTQCWKFWFIWNGLDHSLESSCHNTQRPCPINVD